MISSVKLQTKKLREMAFSASYEKELAGFRYKVLPKIYPGGTDTELLCNCLDVKRGEEVLEIGTGVGLVALKAKKMGAKYVLATDIYPLAVKNAKLNSELLGIKIQVKKTDVFDGIRKRFDVIAFNPPFTDYLAKSGFQVCFWDKDNKAVKKFFKGLAKHLKKNGRAYLCWSSFGNINFLKELAVEYSFNLLRVGKRKGKHNFLYFVYKITPKIKN